MTALDQRCAVCGKYGTRSSDAGVTWRCYAHDSHNNGPLIQPEDQPPHPPSWDPCQACDGGGCPWCQPVRFGLPPRKQFTTAA